jgi:hypothetical protein
MAEQAAAVDWPIHYEPQLKEKPYDNPQFI